MSRIFHKSFDPKNFGNPIVWFDTMRQDSVTLSGANVTGVRDLSSYNKTITPTSNPQFSATGLNGKPTIQFPGSGNVLSVADDSDFTLATFVAFFSFVRVTDAGSPQAIFTKGSTGTSNLEYRAAISSGDVFNPNFSTNGSAATTTFSVGSAGFAAGVPYVGCVGYDGTNVYGAHLTGQTIVENSATSAALHNGAGALQIGSSFGAISISEFTLFGASMPIEQRRLYMHKLAQKWIR